MRVLHVLPSIAQAYGGPTRSLAGFCRASTAAGIEIEIAAPPPPDADVAWLKGEIGSGIPVRLFPSAGQGAFVVSPGLAAWALRSARDYDVMHVHGLLNLVSSVAARIATIRGTPLVVRPFGMLSRYTHTHRRRSLKQLFHATLDRPNLRRAGAFHFTTDSEQDGAAWLGLEMDGRSFVIPPPVATTEAVSREPGSERLTVVCICRIDPVKNLASLLDAWPAVAERFPAARLVVAGDGDRNYVRSLRERPSIAGRADVEFCGFVDGVAKAQLLAQADVFALPSYHENFGVSIVEALTAGVAVVTTPEVGVAPFIVRHQLGRIVAGEPGATAEAIASLLGDAESRSAIRTRAPKAVAAEFSLAAVGSGLRRMYETVLSGK